jgi:xylulokinase
MNENPSEPLLGLDVRTPGSMGVLARTDDEVVATSDQPHEPSLPHGGRTEHESDEVFPPDFVAIFGELPEEADGPIAAVAQRRRSVLFGHWRDRETTWTSMANTVEPNPANRQIHDELYAVYKDLYSATRPITYPLTDLRTRWGDPLEMVAK